MLSPSRPCRGLATQRSRSRGSSKYAGSSRRWRGKSSHRTGRSALVLSSTFQAGSTHRVGLASARSTTIRPNGSASIASHA